MALKHFYTAQSLSSGQEVTLDESLAHRLSRVLRLSEGAPLALFNGQDGLFEAVLTHPKRGLARVGNQLSAQPAGRPLALAICLPKRDAWDSVLRQATELGVSDIHPLLSRHAVADKINPDRVRPRLIEAAEQSERLTVPVLHPLQPLESWLAAQTQPFLWAYERQGATPTASPAPELATVLVGPEGGFSQQEITALQASTLAKPMSLGNTILRVDTAVVAALSRMI